MATIATDLTTATLTLRAEGLDPLSIPWEGPAAAPVRSVSIWQSEGLQAEDCGGEAAEWLTAALGTSAALVRAGSAFRRTVPERKLPGWLRSAAPEPQPTAASARLIGFPDGFPFMIISDATLAELNGRLAQAGEPAVPMERFRPSFVVRGAAPFAEDRWKRFQAGSVPFSGGGPCARCIVTNTDPWTGSRGLEPLRLLSTYRRDSAVPTKINFGLNALHERPAGVVRVGDPVTVLESEA